MQSVQEIIESKLKEEFNKAKKKKKQFGEFTPKDERKVQRILQYPLVSTQIKKVKWICRMTQDWKRLVRRAFVFYKLDRLDLGDRFMNRAFLLMSAGKRGNSAS